MPWPQINDLKGNDSPNVKDWGIKQVPMYCLADGQGKLIEWDIPYEKIPGYVNNYLAKY